MQLVPFVQRPQSTVTPQTVPDPHSQSTPHFGTTQQTPLTHVLVPHEQSPGHDVQFSPVTQSPSPQTGLHAPPWHVVPDAQVGPHEPPHPSGPQVAPAQAGVQQLAAVEPELGLHV